MKYNDVINTLNKYNISPKKYLGQNFLIDDNITKNIVNSSNINKDINVIEIGPGLGALTSYLSEASNKVLCYEVDNDMINILNDKFKDSNVIIKNKDFLEADINKDIKEYFDNKDIYIVANLPYYITTPILLKVLEETNNIKQITIMIQKEVANRLCGNVSTKEYNALSVLIQYYTNPKILFNVNSSSFYPRPDVDSSVVLIKYYENLPYVADDEEFFKNFNRNIFKMRRKTLMNNLKNSYNISKEKLNEFFIDNDLNLNIRSEELKVQEIVALANNFKKYCEG